MNEILLEFLSNPAKEIGREMQEEIKDYDLKITTKQIVKELLHIENILEKKDSYTKDDFENFIMSVHPFILTTCFKIVKTFNNITEDDYYEEN